MVRLPVVRACAGQARPGQARPGLAWLGSAIPDEAQRVLAWPVDVELDFAVPLGPGVARQGCSKLEWACQ